MELEITLVIAAAAALLNIWLSMRVGRVRQAQKISIGDGGSDLLARRMRAHANFAEYTPFFLILLALVELARGAALWLWIVAIVYVLGRIAHAFGMDGRGRWRMIGILTTMLGLLVLAAYALFIAYAGMTHAGAAAPASSATV